MSMDTKRLAMQEARTFQQAIDAAQQQLLVSTLHTQEHKERQAKAEADLAELKLAHERELSDLMLRQQRHAFQKYFGKLPPIGELREIRIETERPDGE